MTARDLARILEGVPFGVVLEAFAFTRLDLLVSNAAMMNALVEVQVSLESLRSEIVVAPRDLREVGVRSFISSLPLNFRWLGYIAYMQILLLNGDLTVDSLSAILELLELPDPIALEASLRGQLDLISANATGQLFQADSLLAAWAALRGVLSPDAGGTVDTLSATVETGLSNLSMLAQSILSAKTAAGEVLDELFSSLTIEGSSHGSL